MISIVIPAYNEAKFIESTLSQVSEYIKSEGLEAEVIVVAANGGDGTADLSRSQSSLFHGLKVIEHPGRVGKGRDVKSGMLAATGDKVIMMDADLATPLYHVDTALQLLDHADVVVGARDIDQMHEGLARRASSRLAHVAIWAMAVRGVQDTQCGFKGFRRDAAHKLFEKQTIMGWGWDFEILALARKFNMKIDELKIDDWADPKGDDGLAGDSQLSAMVSTMRELVQVRWNFITGKYR